MTVFTLEDGNGSRLRQKSGPECENGTDTIWTSKSSDYVRRLDRPNLIALINDKIVEQNKATFTSQILFIPFSHYTTTDD